MFSFFYIDSQTYEIPPSWLLRLSNRGELSRTVLSLATGHNWFLLHLVLETCLMCASKLSSIRCPLGSEVAVSRILCRTVGHPRMRAPPAHLIRTLQHEVRVVTSRAGWVAPVLEVTGSMVREKRREEKRSRPHEVSKGGGLSNQLVQLYR